MAENGRHSQKRKKELKDKNKEKIEEECMKDTDECRTGIVEDKRKRKEKIEQKRK